MKVKRSDRLVDMTFKLLDNPYTLIPLTTFSEEFQAAKSSISEDLVIIKNRFAKNGIGTVETIAGAAGGIRYIPFIDEDKQQTIVDELVEELNHSERLLPGNFVYLTDIICQPVWLKKIGSLIASQYADKNIENVMTVATSGIPIAQAVASYLNVPFTIVTRDSRVTEGSTVSVNYVSGANNQQVEKMELSRRSLEEGARVLIVDDFIKSGGTIEGMQSLLGEFNAELVGACAIAENNPTDKRNNADLYQSIIRVTKTDEASKKIQVEAGNFI